MDDARIGRVLRALRHRLGWRQSDVAARAGVSQDLVSLAELGRIEGMQLRRVRRVARALGADLVIALRWRGGDIDRLLDEGHAALCAAVAASLQRAGWNVRPEVSFAVWGERGSIDLLCWHEPTRTLLVIEVKSELTSAEETLRRIDVKGRLAAQIARDRFGWNPRRVVPALVLPEAATARRRVARHAALFRARFPASGVEARRWLRQPDGPAPGGVLLFQSLTSSVRGRRDPIGRKRIRRTESSLGRAHDELPVSDRRQPGPSDLDADSPSTNPARV